MEAGAAALRARMGSQEPHEWTAEDRAAISAASVRESGGYSHFGSDFVFRTPEHEPLWAEHSDVHALRPSFAKGGLSNGWGAAVLPYRDEDMDAWPIRAGDLAPHYAAVAPILQVAGRKDDLAAIFPAYAHPADRPLPTEHTSDSTARPPFDEARSFAVHGPPFRHGVKGRGRWLPAMRDVPSRLPLSADLQRRLRRSMRSLRKAASNIGPE